MKIVIGIVIGILLTLLVIFLYALKDFKGFG